MPSFFPRAEKFAAGVQRGLLDLLFPAASPLDLRILGRMLFHAALVGAIAGLMGTVFFLGLEVVQRFLLEDLAGYVPLRAHGEGILPVHEAHAFRPFLLVVLPALGALCSGMLTAWVAPEAQGGGGDAMIEAFHHKGGMIRRRIIWVKALASIFTLGAGGSGGREGPTMQIGGAIGSLVSRYLRVSVRERRILLVVGVAAGISAVFRTPLGAALLAVEVLYRDDFESDALIPAVLGSVVSYSVVISILGESTMFAHAQRYPFVPRHLLLYGLLAILVALLATVFVALLRTVQRLTARLPVPLWARPALGGMALGVFCTPIVVLVGHRIGMPGHGLGLLGGGYGAVQMAITGSPWLPGGIQDVELLALLLGAKLVAVSLTIGTGGSAGDFAPSLVFGGLLGGIFGRLMQMALHDPQIDPGAFALVGMGTFYGGIAHVPLSSLVLVCELAGSYDLLVPLMLAEGIAFVALRSRSLYTSQLPSQRDSPAHRDAQLLDVLKQVRVQSVMTHGRPYLSFRPNMRAAEVVQKASDTTWQDAFPVIGPGGNMVGMITTESLRLVAAERDIEQWALAADVMQPPVTARPTDDLRTAIQTMLQNGVRELPVVDEGGHIVGFLDEADVTRAYLEATVNEDRVPGSSPGV